MTAIVSLNGRDGSGKTLQGRLLGVGHSGQVHVLSRRADWPDLSPQDFSDW